MEGRFGIKIADCNKNPLGFLELSVACSAACSLTPIALRTPITRSLQRWATSMTFPTKVPVAWALAHAGALSSGKRGLKPTLLRLLSETTSMANLAHGEGTPVGSMDSPWERAKCWVASMCRQPQEAPGATDEGFDSPVLGCPQVVNHGSRLRPRPQTLVVQSDQQWHPAVHDAGTRSILKPVPAGSDYHLGPVAAQRRDIAIRSTGV